MAEGGVRAAIADIVRLALVVLVDRVISHCLPDASGDGLLLLQETGVALGSATAVWTATQLLFAAPRMNVNWAECSGPLVRGSTIRLEHVTPPARRFFQVTVDLQARSRLARWTVRNLRGKGLKLGMTFNPGYGVKMRVDKRVKGRATCVGNVVTVDLDSALDNGTVAAFVLQIEAGRTVDSTVDVTLRLEPSCAPNTRWLRLLRLQSTVSSIIVVKVTP